MPPPCAASSKLALTTVLQSVFRAEIASGLQLQPSAFYARETPFLPRGFLHSAPKFNGKRYFGSSRVLYASSTEKSPPSDASAIAGNESTTVKQHDENGTILNPEDGSDKTSEVLQRDKVISDSTLVGSSPVTEVPEPKRSKNPKNKSSKTEAEIASKSKSKSNKNADKSRDTRLPEKKKKREPWQIHKEAMKSKFKEGWAPPKKLSPDAIEGIRHLHATAPEQFTTPVLAEQFKLSPESIRRILKSKWRPTEEQMEDRRKRWERRHDRIWSQMAELGLRPQKPLDDQVSDVATLYDRKDGKKPI